jgi:hypothetical protein
MVVAERTAFAWVPYGGRIGRAAVDEGGAVGPGLPGAGQVEVDAQIAVGGAQFAGAAGFVGRYRPTGRGFDQPGEVQFEPRQPLQAARTGVARRRDRWRSRWRVGGG